MKLSDIRARHADHMRWWNRVCQQRQVVMPQDLQDVDAVLRRLDVARGLLRECLSDYAHPSFTDRYGMAGQLRAALKEIEGE